MLKQALVLLVVGWLPGAAMFRLPWGNRDRRAGLDAEERLFWAVMISAAVSSIVVLGLAALREYSFQRLLICDGAIAFVALLASRFRVRLGAAARWPGPGALIPIGLLILALWRFFPSAEYVAGGRDPGTYVNEGIQLAQRGALTTIDATVAGVPEFARDLFFPSHERVMQYGIQDYYGLRFMGFWIRDPGSGEVVGQFPHLFPASMAIGYGVDGLTGARRTVGVWAVLGVLAVYFAGARLVGRRAAGAGAALLAFHVIQVWFARYPNAELVMQALLFAALLAFARAHVDGDIFFAPVAGVLLGLMLFLRFDAVIGIAGVTAGVVLATFKGQRVRWTFVVPLLAAVGLAVPYMLGPMRAYTSLYFAFIMNLRAVHALLLLLVASAAIAGLIVAARRPRLSALVVHWVPVLVTVIMVGLALYALFWRHPAGKLAVHDAYALRVFTHVYFTLPALIAALVGFSLVARHEFWRDATLFATVSIFAIFVFYKIRIVPEHFWMARRFVPVILPAALLFVGAAAFYGGGVGWRGRLLRPLIGTVFIALLGAHYARVSTPLLAHVEYAGLIPELERLANAAGPEDLVIMESRDAGSDIHVLALPLAYIYARNVLVLHSPKPDKPTFAAFVEWARTRYQRVMFIGGGGTDLLSHRYGVEVLASERFRVPEYETSRERLPTSVRYKDFDYGVYRFTGDPGSRGTAFDLDVGTEDDLHVVRFHAKERSGERTFRWTGPLSFVTVTTIQSTSRQVTLWASNGGRPQTVNAAEVQVTLHNHVLGTIRVTDGFRPYTLAIPAAVAANAASAGDPVVLKLVSLVWNPARVAGTPDNRELGIMVDRVAVN